MSIDTDDWDFGDVEEAYKSRVAELEKEVASWRETYSVERYWEARYRDEAAENDRLRAALEEIEDGHRYPAARAEKALKDDGRLITGADVVGDVTDVSAREQNGTLDNGIERK